MKAPRSHLQILIKPYSVPFLFVEEAGPNLISSIGGTALLWQSPEDRFVVGSAHAWRDFEKRRTGRGRMSICIGLGIGKPVSLLDSDPIAIDDRLDVVVLSARSLNPVHLGKKAFCETKTWPLKSASNDETVGFIGFPGEMRSARGFTLETSSFYYENRCAVASSSEVLLIGAFQADPPVTVFHTESSKEVVDFGGISGAPVFALRNGAAEWVGVVKRGAEERGIDTGIQATPAHFVRSNGTISSA